MARPIKQGIEYFSFDVDFFSDIKVKKIMRACGTEGITILLNILCNIYRDKGYYMEWDEEVGFLISDEIGVSESSVAEVVHRAVQVNFFNESLFEKYQILTSNGIQQRFLKATYQRKDNKINPSYLCSNSYESIKETKQQSSFSYEKPSKSYEKLSNRSVSHAESTQSKVKESKVNKSKVKHHPADDSEYQKLVDLYQNNFGQITPIVGQDLQYNLNDFGYELVYEAMKRAAFNKKHYSYVVGILKDWASNNIDDIDKVNAQDLEHKQKTSGYSPNLSKVGQVPEWAKEPQKAEATQEEMDALEERFKKLEQREVTD